MSEAAQARRKLLKRSAQLVRALYLDARRVRFLAVLIENNRVREGKDVRLATVMICW